MTIDQRSQILELWNITNSKKVRSFTGHRGSIMSFNISPDGGFIVSGGTDKAIRIYDIEMGRTIKKMVGGHNDWVVSVKFSPDSRYLISLSFNRVILWELDWVLEFPNEVKWHNKVEPYIMNFIKLNNYQWTEEQFDQFYQKLQYAGLGWVRKNGIQEKMKEIFLGNVFA